MGFLAALKAAASGLKDRLGISGAAEIIKEKILGRAAAPGPAPLEEEPTLMKYLDAWRSAEYRGYVTPQSYVEEGERVPVLGREFYAEGPEEMETKYQTFFMGYGMNKTTGEFEAQPFTVSHDDLLYEDEMAEIADEFGYDIDFMQIDAIAGLTSLGEVYI